MISAIILLGTLFINTSAHAVTRVAGSSLLAQLHQSQTVAMRGNQPEDADWFSLSPLEKMNRVKAVHLPHVDLPQIIDQKRCSDMDTVLNGCKEQPGSFEEGHQRTALAYSRQSGSY